MLHVKARSPEQASLPTRRRTLTMPEAAAFQRLPRRRSSSGDGRPADAALSLSVAVLSYPPRRFRQRFRQALWAKAQAALTPLRRAAAHAAARARSRRTCSAAPITRRCHPNISATASARSAPSQNIFSTTGRSRWNWPALPFNPLSCTP